MFTTYILYSRSNNRFYTGHCEDLKIRFSQHNHGRNTSTKAGIPWEIIYSREFETRTEAIAWEEKVKKRGAKRFLTDLKIQIG